MAECRRRWSTARQRDAGRAQPVLEYGDGGGGVALAAVGHRNLGIEAAAPGEPARRFEAVAKVARVLLAQGRAVGLLAAAALRRRGERQTKGEDRRHHQGGEVSHELFLLSPRWE